MKFLKIILYFFFLTGVLNNLNAEDDAVFKKLLIYLDSNFNYKQLSYYGFDEETAKLKENQCEIIADKYEIDLLNSLNVKYKILLEDIYTEYLEKINIWKKSNSIDDLLLDSDISYGSMGSYFTLEEIYAEFNKMRNDYPAYFVSVDTIGFTYEKRPIILYTFGDTLSREHEVIITSLHHAREPGGASVVIYFLKNLLRRAKDNDKEATFLLKNRTIYVIPVVNPDGYYFNEMTRPEGGGMWRKNRALNIDSTFGVDLNRNYGPFEFWNAPVDGSSEEPKETTFRGTAPFSENETQAIRDFVVSKDIKLAINYHTYGNLFLYPYSALVKETPDSTYFRNLCEEFAMKNRYVYGRDIETVNYAGRGVSDDWYYWTGGSKKTKTYAVTPEVGTVEDNFWATPDRIAAQCRENLYMNYQFLWSADVNWRPKMVRLEKINGREFVEYVALNTGVTNTKSKPIVDLKSLNTDCQIDNEVSYDTLKRMEYRTYFGFRRDKEVKNGYLLKVEVRTKEKNVLRLDTMSLYIWEPDTFKIFVDEKLYGKWDKEKWNGEYNLRRNRFVMSDSPNGNYQNNDTNSLTLLEPIDLKYRKAYLQFDSYWNIETNYDYAIVEISTDMGANWKKLDTKKMTYGSGARGATIQTNETGFTGVSHKWYTNRIDLEKYLNKKVEFRFSLLSDAATNMAGWLIDNIMLITYNEIETNVSQVRTNEYKVYPNPAKVNDKIIVERSAFYKIQNIEIFDMKGNQISVQLKQENKGLSFQITHSGIYLLMVNLDEKRRLVSKLIVK